MTPISECPKIYRDLHRHVTILAQLLEAPEPGLSTWIEMVIEHVRAIAILCDGRKRA